MLDSVRTTDTENLLRASPTVGTRPLSSSSFRTDSVQHDVLADRRVLNRQRRAERWRLGQADSGEAAGRQPMMVGES